MPRPAIAQKALVVMIAALLPGIAHGQVPEKRPDGFRAGSFIVAPKVTLTTGFDSNLLRSPTRPDGTMTIVLTPEVEILSDWRRHALQIDAGTSIGAYPGSDADNFLDAHFNAKAQVDVTRRARITLGAGIERGHDARSSDDLPQGVSEPVRFIAFDLALAAEVEFGAFQIAPFATFRQLDFRDVALSTGGTLDQDNRDRTEAEIGLEVGYTPTRWLEFFLRTSVFDISYRRSVSTAGPARDALGLTALSGFRAKFGTRLGMRLAVGAAHRDYDHPGFSDLTTLTVDARIGWLPTRRIKVVADVRREIAETALAGAIDRIGTAGGLSVEYELLRHVTLGARTRISHDDFSGVSRRDLGLAVGFGAEWSPMRGMSLSPDYAFHRLSSDAAGQGYSAHIFTLSATYSFGAQE